MISVQTFHALGCPAGWKNVGVRVWDIAPVDAQGYGLGRQRDLAHVFEAIRLEIGPDAMLVGMTVSERHGSAHQSYNRRIYSIMGDLYVKEAPTGIVEDDNQRRVELER